MNQAEVQDWLYGLPYFNTYAGTKMVHRRCQNDVERVEVIEDLLRNATSDKMSLEDRRVCIEVLEYLRSKESHGESIKRREGPRVSELQHADPDRLEGPEETFPCLLPNVAD